MHTVLLLDTPNIWHGQALAGTPARTLALAEHCTTAGNRTTLVLADRGADYGDPSDWRCDTQLVHPSDFYDPTTLAAVLAPLAPDLLITCEAEALLHTVEPAARQVGVTLVYDAHDDDSAVAAGLGEPPAVIAHRRGAQRVAMRTADAVIVSTTNEARLARVAGVRTERLLTAPNGADPATRTHHGPDVRAGLLVFVGNLFYGPNAQAVTAIRDIIAPVLRARCAHVRVRIVGRGPEQLIQPGDGVEFTGLVPDLDAALAGATLALAPLTVGSGSKMKVVDYLAAGLPVLGTREAVTGLPPDHPGVVVADDLGTYPRHIADLLADHDRLRRLGQAGRTCVEHHLSWERIGADLARQLTGLLGRSPTPPPTLPGTVDYQLPQWLAEHVRQGALSEAAMTAPGRPYWLRVRAGKASR